MMKFELKEFTQTHIIKNLRLLLILVQFYTKWFMLF